MSTSTFSFRPQRKPQNQATAAAAKPIVTVHAWPAEKKVVVEHSEAHSTPIGNLDLQTLKSNIKFHPVVSFSFDRSNGNYDFNFGAAPRGFPSIYPVQVGEKLQKFEEHRYEEWKSKAYRAQPHELVVETAWQQARNHPALPDSIRALMDETKIVSRRNTLTHFATLNFNDADPDANIYSSASSSSSSQKSQLNRVDAIKLGRDAHEPFYMDRIDREDDPTFFYPRDVLGQAFEKAATIPKSLRDKINAGTENVPTTSLISNHTIVVVEFPITEDTSFKVGVVCEVDCVEKLDDGRSIFSEIKCTVDKPLSADWVLKTWLQSFIGNIQSVWIGYRDLDPFSAVNPALSFPREENNRFHQLTKPMERLSLEELFAKIPPSDYAKTHALVFLWKFLVEISRIDTKALREQGKNGPFKFDVSPLDNSIALTIK